MAEIYKLIHAVKYFNDYISQNLRPDGRKFCDQRNIKLNVHSLKSADSSAVVKCGNTTVVCGIKLELATPKAENPDIGFVVTNVELPPLCSSKCRPGPPSDYAQTISNLVSDILINSKCIDLKELCIVADKLAWVLYCDIVCLDNDGSLVDACIITLITSLKTLLLPSVSYDLETEEIKVDPNVRKHLTVNGMPIATSFSVYNFGERNTILMDPTIYEEEMCGGTGSNLIVSYNNGLLCGAQKLGGGHIIPESIEHVYKLAQARSKLVEDVINTCVESENINK